MKKYHYFSAERKKMQKRIIFVQEHMSCDMKKGLLGKCKNKKKIVNKQRLLDTPRIKHKNFFYQNLSFKVPAWTWK